MAAEVKPARFRFSLRTLFLVMTVSIVAFFLGTKAGLLAVVTGAHGGSPWPTLCLSAPALPFALFLFDDGMAYVRTITLGTGIAYAIYAVLIAATRRPSIILGVFAFHLSAVGLLAIWIFLL